MGNAAENSNGSWYTQTRTLIGLAHGQIYTERETRVDERYQVHYLPASWRYVWLIEIILRFHFTVIEKLSVVFLQTAYSNCILNIKHKCQSEMFWISISSITNLLIENRARIKGINIIKLHLAVMEGSLEHQEINSTDNKQLLVIDCEAGR